MRTLAFDGRLGASGDMLLGALLAAGADPAALAPVEDALDVEFVVESTTRCGVEATTVSVLVPADERTHEGTGDTSHEGTEGEHGHTGHDHSHDEHAGHEHGHGGHDGHESHEHGHGEESDGTGTHEGHIHAEGAGHSRTFPEVLDVVAAMDLPEGVAADARAVFELLGEAEATVHGTTLSETQFHEVGADDAIADVVGTLLLLDDLAVERVVTTPVAAGGGSVETSHGVYPVPAPAVAELAAAADWSLRGGPVEAELLTPTGAAILAHIAAGVATLPTLAVEHSGYGAGDARFEHHPNVLRALVGTATGDLRREPITVLETNLDDATPEVLGGLQETLQDAGALDVSVLPATMKKSRPGHLVKVITRPADARQVARALAEETGTLGVREHGAGHRFVADREQTTVSVEIEGDTFEVGVKCAFVGKDEDGDRTRYDVSAEYDDALAVARETGLAVREVQRRAEQLASEQ